MAGTAVGPTIFWSIRCQPGARRGELHYPVFPFLLFALTQLSTSWSHCLLAWRQLRREHSGQMERGCAAGTRQ